MNLSRLAIAAVTMLAIGAAWRFIAPSGAFGIAVPADKSAYIGEWTAPGHILSIPASGNIHYERHENHVKVNLDVPIQKFSGDDFTVVVLFWTTTFHVTEPPHRDGDLWRMTSDGVAYSHP